MTSLILFFIALLCIGVMFVYLHRKIQSAMNPQEHTKEMALMLDALKERLDMLNDRTRAIEKFAGEVYNTTDTKLSKMQEQNEILEKEYTHWNNMIMHFHSMAQELHNKRETYDDLLVAINTAEQYRTALHNEIHHFEVLEGNLQTLRNKNENTLIFIDNKKNDVVQDFEKRIHDFVENVHSIENRSVNTVIREIDLIRQAETKKIQNDLDIIYTEHDKKQEQFIRDMKSELDNMNSTYTHKSDLLEARIQDRSSLMEQNMMAIVEQCEHTVESSSHSLQENLAQQQQNMDAYMRVQSQKLEALGEKSYTTLRERLDEKQYTIEMSLNQVERSTEHKLSELENKVHEQYEHVTSQINHLSNGVNAVEQNVLDKTRDVQSYVNDINENLRKDYQMLCNEKEELNTQISVTRNEHQRLESQMQGQISMKHQEYIVELMKFIESIKDDISMNAKQKMDDLQILYQVAETDAQKDLQAIREKYLKDLEGDIASFKVSFSEITTRLSDHVDSYKVHINSDLQKMEASLDNKVLILNEKVDNYTSTFGTILKVESDKVIEEHISKIEYRNKEFEKEIKEIITSVEGLKENHRNAYKQLEEEYISLRKEAKDERREYEKFLEMIQKENGHLTQELNNAQERHHDFNMKYKETQQSLLHLKEEHSLLTKDIVEANNIQGTVSSLYQNYGKLEKGIKQSYKQLEEAQHVVKKSIDANQRSLKDIKTIDRRIEKITRYLDGLRMQESNIGEIKKTLYEVQMIQGEVKEYQKELHSWDKDYQVFTQSASELQTRNNNIKKQTETLETIMQSLENKIQHVNKDILEINNNYLQIENIQSKVDIVTKKMPNILNNIEEFKEMQESILETEAGLQATITKADQKLATLGLVLQDRNSPLAKKKKENRQIDPTSRDVQKQVLELHHQKWSEEQIAHTLKLEVALVKVILQKSMVS